MNNNARKNTGALPVDAAAAKINSKMSQNSRRSFQLSSSACRQKQQPLPTSQSQPLLGGKENQGSVLDRQLMRMNSSIDPRRVHAGQPPPAIKHTTRRPSDNQNRVAKENAAFIEPSTNNRPLYQPRQSLGNHQSNYASKKLILIIFKLIIQII